MRHIYDILEFNHIKDILKEHALTSMAKKRIEELEHSTDPVVIFEQLKDLDEAIRITFQFARCPMEGIYDVSDSLIKAHKNGVLNLEEIYSYWYNFRNSIEK